MMLIKSKSSKVSTTLYNQACDISDNFGNIKKGLFRGLYRALYQHNPGLGIKDPPSLPTLAADAKRLGLLYHDLGIDIIRRYEKRDRNEIL